MTTLIGIDAATQAKNIGLARGKFEEHLVVDEVARGSTLEAVAMIVSQWIEEPTLIAVDAPLGWPAPMGVELSKHRAGEHLDVGGNELFTRLTDRTVREVIGKRPLEVGANLIARAALAALHLLEKIRVLCGLELPLLWQPSGTRSGIIEVYPAATLLSRGLPLRGYKTRDASGSLARGALLDKLDGEFELRVDRGQLEVSDHAFDAALCLVAAADFLRGDAIAPPEDDGRVPKEGWIWFKPPRG